MTRRSIGMLAAAGALLLVWFNGDRLLAGYGDWLNVGRPLAAPVDAVYIFGGGADTRPLCAAAILQAGYAEAALVPDPAPFEPPGVEDLRESELIAGMLASEGIERSDMEVLPLAEASTAGEVRAIGTYLAAHPTATLALVTDDYHTRRCLLLLRDELSPGDETRIRLVSCPTDGFSPSDWWRRPAGLMAYLLESIKLARTLVSRAAS